MKAAWDTVIAFKLVWLRVLFYMLGPIVTGFLVITQTIDMDVKWPQMGTFARWGFWVGLCWPGVSALISFIDQSLQRARDELKTKLDTDIQTLIGHEKPPQ